MPAKAPVDGDHETDLPNLGGIVLDQVVAAQAQPPDQRIIVALQILDPAPDQIRGLLAGEAGEIVPVDQRHAGAPAR